MGRLVVEAVGLPRVQALLLAAYDLLQAVEHSDEVLLTDDVVEKAKVFRAEIKRGLRR